MYPVTIKRRVCVGCLLLCYLNRISLRRLTLTVNQCLFILQVLAEIRFNGTSTGLPASTHLLTRASGTEIK